MKFHGVHGSNVTIDEGGSRASRVSSFCDGITFSHKPLSINSRVSILVGANEDWTGALRIGVTSQDPNHNKKLPRYLCPDLTSKPGYWARPLPESWVVNGNRLTFYVNGRGHFHLFINNDHKGAILTGLPTKEQLWIVLDLYGITVSVKFVSNSGTAPTEVVARGPEAVQAYQHALTHGSTPYYHTRIAIIGPSDDKKTVLKKSFLKICDLTEPECEGIDTTCFCQTTERSIGQPWTWLRLKNRFSVEDNDNNQFENSDEINGNNSDKREEDSHLVIYGDEEYFKAMAINIVREMILQKKKDDRKKTAVSKNGFRLQSSLSKIGSSRAKLDEVSNSKELICTQEGLPEDLPMRVIELVEALLKESDCKILAEKKEKQSCENLAITFNVWNYSGHIKYLFLHQLFLSPQTIYVFVFDLSEDLDAPILKAEDYGFEFSPNDCLSYLSLLHIWLELVYVSIAYPKEEHKNSTEENIINDIVCTLFPPILIVGVQEDSTTFDSVVETQFNKIKESIQDKVYYHLVHPTFYYVGSPDTMAVDSMISELREKIQELALQMPHFGMEIPLKWMLFEQAIDRLVEREVYFADICKLFEVARLEGIDCEEEFHSMIHFYHHHGKIWHLTSDRHQNNENCSVVILKPQWFINYVYKLLSEESYILCKEYFELHEHNKKMFTSEIFDNIWPNAFHHVNILLSMLDSTDVLSLTSVENSDNEKLIESLNVGIPWLVEDKLDTSSNFNFDCLVLILDFSGLLPVGLFTKLMVRLFRWSSRHDWKGNSNNRKNEIPIDYNHSIKLQKIHGHRIQVVITQKNYLETEEEVNFSYPSPHICSKVRHLLERETEYLCDVWYKRLSFSLNIPCPCAKSCKLHTTIKCTDYQCIHLLPLNECLIKKVIECDYRLVKTDFIQKYFFSASIEGDFTKCSESMQLTMDSITVPFWNEQDVIHEDLPWMTCVGKMLTCANTGHDWIALARRLSYSEREIKRFEEETVPPISLLNNWINSNGRTRYCIDLLISCLEQMGRQDVANYISVELGQPDLPSPPVFISYQWDSQEAVLQLRKRIELAGYSCWMDVGHMLGGDALYGKIYEGINKSKVVLCCLTPRYVLSPLCTREMSLADVLRKPIVPIILESTPWPPPGALALILSSLVYVDLCGIGGHGGNGKQADWESRFSSIIERLSHFISPSFISPPLSNMPSERHAPPTIIRNPEEFLDALEQSDEQEVLETIPLPDGDSVSESVSIPDPTVWEPPHRNRVIRCSVCVLL